MSLWVRSKNCFPGRVRSNKLPSGSWELNDETGGSTDASGRELCGYFSFILAKQTVVQIIDLHAEVVDAAGIAGTAAQKRYADVAVE